MTDKNLKQEECTLAVKAPRAHTSASIHQMPQQNASVLAPHGGFPMGPDVVHHPHLSYRMLQPSFQSYPLTLSAPLPGSKPGQISNDLGPPIFMPPLNLGIPKSSSSSGPVSSTNVINKQPQIMSASSTSSTPTGPAHQECSSSSSAITSYSNLVTPSGTPYHTSPVLHPSSQQPYPAQNSANVAAKGQFLHKNNNSSQEQDKPSHPNSSSNKGSVKLTGNTPLALGYPSSNLGGLGMGPGRGQANVVKHSAGAPKATTSVSGMVELSAGYSMSGQYHQQQHHAATGKQAYSRVQKDNHSDSLASRNKMDADDASLCGGLGSGNVLVCTEGLPPPVPRNLDTGPTCMTSDNMKTDNRSTHSANHISESHHSSLQASLTGSESQIPWPEAVSKNIIIPAPNLTGKDIANLTSAMSSPIATNDRTGNDVSWLPLSDNHHHQSDNHVPSSSSSSMDSLLTSSGSSGGSSSSNSNMLPSHDSSYLQTGSNSSGVGMGLVPQNAMASPRPSILRKRGFDGRPMETSAFSNPSSLGMHKLLRQRSRGSPGEPLENHFAKEDVSSPRKRPRKQQLYIDSTNDHFHMHTSQDTDPASFMNETVPARNSMIANERLLGPLPLKEKKPVLTNSTDEQSSLRADKQDKGGHRPGVIYMSQLRKSQFPMVQLCRRTHRTARNHYRRHADIKHREEEAVSPHELCNQSSTWLRSSGWKLQHFNTQLEKIETYESDVLLVMERLKEKFESVLDTMSEEELAEKHRKFLEETMMGNIERIKRSKLHTQETRENMMKILDVNGKVVEIMKKFAVNLPTKLLTTTSVTAADEDDSPT